MVYDLANKEIVHRFKGTASISGNQYYFNIPVFAIRNKYIDAVKEYWIFIVENKPPHDKKLATKEQLQEMKPYLEDLLPFTATPAKSGSAYRITIPAYVIENLYFDPKEKKKYWIYFVKELE